MIGTCPKQLRGSCPLVIHLKKDNPTRPKKNPYHKHQLFQTTAAYEITSGSLSAAIPPPAPLLSARLWLTPWKGT